MDARTRLSWVRLYKELGNAGVVCRRYGISRPILRKWRRSYQAEGEVGLQDRSRRPHHSPNRKVFEHEEELILAQRRPDTAPAIGLDCIANGGDGLERKLRGNRLDNSLSVRAMPRN